MKLVNLSNLLFIGVLAALISCGGAKPAEESTTVEETPVAASALEDGTYVFSADSSKVKWHGTKVGGEHMGHVLVAGGKFMVEGGAIKGGSFDIDLNTISADDLVDAPDMKAKLEGHLKSADFFAIEVNPMATFTIKSVVSDSTGTMITGDLSIKNISNEVSFPATVAADGASVSTKASFKLDRTKWDMMFHSGLEKWGDKAIHDEFTIEFDLVASKEAAM